MSEVNTAELFRVTFLFNHSWSPEERKEWLEDFVFGKDFIKVMERDGVPDQIVDTMVEGSTRWYWHEESGTECEAQQIFMGKSAVDRMYHSFRKLDKAGVDYPIKLLEDPELVNIEPEIWFGYAGHNDAIQVNASGSVGANYMRVPMDYGVLGQGKLVDHLDSYFENAFDYKSSVGYWLVARPVFYKALKNMESKHVDTLLQEPPLVKLSTIAGKKVGNVKIPKL